MQAYLSLPTLAFSYFLNQKNFCRAVWPLVLVNPYPCLGTLGF